MLFALNVAAEDDNGGALSTTNLCVETQACIACHYVYTPGIVMDWLSSRHSKTLPAEAMKKNPLERRISEKHCLTTWQTFLSDVMNATASILKIIKTALNIWDSELT